MKAIRLFPILLGIGLLISSAHAAGMSDITFCPYTGDVTKDTRLDAHDALLILHRSVSLIEFDSTQEQTGDINMDGRIDANDALMVLQTSVGLQHPLDWSASAQTGAHTNFALQGMKTKMLPCFPIEPDPNPPVKTVYDSLEQLREQVAAGETEIPVDQLWFPAVEEGLTFSDLWSLETRYGYTVTVDASEWSATFTFLPGAASPQQALRAVLPPSDTTGNHPPLLWANWMGGSALISSVDNPVAVFMMDKTAVVVCTQRNFDLAALLTLSDSADEGRNALFGWMDYFSFITE